MTTKQKMLRLTLVRSTNKRIRRHKETVKGLGLRRLNHTVERQDTPSIRGMVDQVSYLLKVEEV